MRHVLLLAALLLPGCASSGYYGRWHPKPLELNVDAADGTRAGLFSAAVLGRWHGEPYDDEVHVRLRVENSGNAPIVLPLERLQLLSGDLQPFSAPRLVGGQPGEIAPGASGSVDAGFSPPVEDPDLRSLQLRWVLVVDGQELPGSATFQRADPAYPAYYPSVHVGVGWGIHSGWWDGGGWCPPSGGGGVHALPPHTSSLPPKP